MRWVGGGGGVCFFQTHSRDQGSLFLVIFAMYFYVIGRVRFFQTHCREQESLFLVIVAMHSDLTGRGGGVWFFQNRPVNQLTTPVG